MILREVHLGRDAPIGAALLLQLLVEEGRSLSAIVASLPRYVIVKDKLDRPNASLDTVYAALRSAFTDAVVDLQDGLRRSRPGRRVHVPPCGTDASSRGISGGPGRGAGAGAARRAAGSRARPRALGATPGRGREGGVSGCGLPSPDSSSSE